MGGPVRIERVGELSHEPDRRCVSLRHSMRCWAEPFAHFLAGYPGEGRTPALEPFLPGNGGREARAGFLLSLEGGAGGRRGARSREPLVEKRAADAARIARRMRAQAAGRPPAPMPTCR